MQNDIQNKLKACLELSSLNERDAVYILVEIGKLIELTDSFNEYRALWFYRNWAVHSRIDGGAFVDDLRERFKSLHVVPETVDRVLGFVTFTEVTNEIIRFFHQQVEKDLIPRREFLDSFKKALMQVIADVPIRLRYRDAIIVLTFDRHSKLIVEGPGEYRGNIEVLV